MYCLYYEGELLMGVEIAVNQYDNITKYNVLDR